MTDMPEQMRNPFKTAVRERKLIIGIWNSIANNTVTEVLARTGFEWMLMDSEHSTAELSTLVPQMQSMKGSPTSVVIRPAVERFRDHEAASGLRLLELPGADGPDRGGSPRGGRGNALSAQRHSGRLGDVAGQRLRQHSRLSPLRQ